MRKLRLDGRGPKWHTMQRSAADSDGAPASRHICMDDGAPVLFGYVPVPVPCAAARIATSPMSGGFALSAPIESHSSTEDV